MTRLALFDCDGTLVDSGATIVGTIGETFIEHGLTVPCAQASRRVVGLSLHEAMASLAPDADADDHAALATTYRAIFFRRRSEGRVEEPLYAGIVKLLEAFEADGWLLGVATGKSDRGLRHCLESHGIAVRFMTLQTSDRHPSKPHPSMALAALAEARAAPETSVMIGDTAYDMAMGRAAGMGAIGVGWGYHDADELVAAGAHGVAEAPDDVIGIARSWLEMRHG
ncbi:MAG TPA: HAD-IA family hydrolase [Sphingomicrobium sp.]|nr:HAD-IA family hydrolase [Sphingomicrobium sp.]